MSNQRDDRRRGAASTDKRSAAVTASARGMSAIEVMITLALVSIVGGLAVASVAPETKLVQEEAAARFLVMQIRQVRQEALQRSTSVGLRFEQDGERTQFREYVDGNANGLRTREIQDRIDTPIGPARHLEDDFGGASFGVTSALPPIDAGGDRLDAGADPIHVGTSRILSFGPTGRGSSGTVYVRGRGGQQFAVRIFGQTGRVRLLEFRAAEAQWVER
jgi:prepilin-type N-terminal cleavage/methylation domain-containing protein